MTQRFRTHLAENRDENHSPETVTSFRTKGRVVEGDLLQQAHAVLYRTAVEIIEGLLK